MRLIKKLAYLFIDMKQAMNKKHRKHKNAWENSKIEDTFKSL